MKKFTFPGAQGHELAARLDLPKGEVRAYALFAHCFTCTKDIFGAANIARALNENGIAVMRFDFTGLGASEGEFANTNFTSNVQDLVAAAAHMRETLEAPAILIGHSLGGAAVLAAAGSIPEVKAVATIAAPADAAHVAHHFSDKREDIMAQGEAEVCLVGRPFRIQRQFIEDIEAQTMDAHIAGLKRALLVCHAPLDDVVGAENAAHIFTTARHPKSFLSLDDADHLLSRKEHAVYAAGVIAAWAARYIEDKPVKTRQPDLPDHVTLVRPRGQGLFQQDVFVGKAHHLTADEPAGAGGKNAGPTPYEFLAIALGSCTAMTLRLYADHKQIPLDDVEVYLTHDKIHAKDCADCETREGKLDEFTREIVIKGDKLTAEQRARLLEIADKCPVHRTLEGEVKVRTAEKTTRTKAA